MLSCIPVFASIINGSRRNAFHTNCSIVYQATTVTCWLHNSVSIVKAVANGDRIFAWTKWIDDEDFDACWCDAVVVSCRWSNSACNRNHPNVRRTCYRPYLCSRKESESASALRRLRRPSSKQWRKFLKRPLSSLSFCRVLLLLLWCFLNNIQFNRCSCGCCKDNVLCG